ncbi:MAG: aminotransferase class IV [Corynebacterium sp.]|uniref:aminotransferase class IV n=1 Tax=Corynebacterium TaxID=1716 RepID=UPI00066D94F3|nr:MULTISPECIES: aminotransferase class IV [unclassified Corynebacterium]MBS5996889.1 aminotransferase class IV [Corynebacterium sp.]MDU1462538.1 aminotransferase class IV [Corynebacterium sp.]MDU5016895.1 aminotransferase class IV [Corynebacterium sp.]
MSTYLWHESSFIPSQAHPGPFDVADSWRMLGDAHSSALRLHLRRFESVAGPLPAGFVPAMLQRFAPGDLFPRISLAAGQLRLDIRPAPPARPVTRLTYAQAPDPRSQPLVKGPDFPALARYRAEYQDDGADDTVIVDSSGAMLETTTGALVAWEEETLILPTGTALPSITLHQVTQRAAALGIRTETRPLTPELATACPLWFLNSLHGISPVTELYTPTGIVYPPCNPHTATWEQWWWDSFYKETGRD